MRQISLGVALAAGVVRWLARHRRKSEKKKLDKTTDPVKRVLIITVVALLFCIL